MRRKIAQFCNVAPEAVIQSIDRPSIYEVPVAMHEQHLDEIVLRKMAVQPQGEPAHGSVVRFPRQNEIG